MGYYNNPAKTEEAFVQNPLNRCYPEKIYRTGDLVKYNKEHQLIYCARKDFQIKHMGHRIELGEIEIAMDRVDSVNRSCCLYDAEKERIVLFYEAEESCDEKILEVLTKKLPKYMIPTQFFWFEKLPLNKNSKIDRVLLKQKYIEK